MAEHYEVEVQGGIAVIKMIKTFNYSTVRDFRVCWNDVVNKNLFRVILDMRAVEHMDSSGIGSVVTLRIFLDQNRGKLVLINSKDNVCDLFDITGLKTIIQYVNDEDEAKRLVLL